MLTPRLVIRRFAPSDCDDLYEYLGDANVLRYEPYAAYSHEECRKEAARRAEDPSFWAVCLKESGKLIGNIYLKEESRQLSTWEIGFVFNSLYQGNGYAFESSTALIDYTMRELGAHRMVAMCNPDNHASWRLLERLGFRREGHLQKNIYFRLDENGSPIWQDTYEYAILAQEWLERHPKKPFTE